MLELAFAKEGGEDSLAALATMFVGRAMIDGSACRPVRKAGIASVMPDKSTPDFDHPALGANEGFLFSSFTRRGATHEDRGRGGEALPHRPISPTRDIRLQQGRASANRLSRQGNVNIGRGFSHSAFSRSRLTRNPI